MSTLTQIVDEILLDLSSYGLSQPRLTSLAADITDSDTTITVTSATTVPVGLVEVGSELMFVQSVNQTLNQLTVIRGFRTTAAAHTAGDLMHVAPPWPRQQVINAVNDAITSSYPQLFKVATTPLVAKSIDNTYDLTAGRVLQVRNLTVGPSTEWLKISRYRFDADLGKLVIYDGMRPSSDIHVVHTTTPTVLAADTDELSTSGLQQSAKAYVVLAATAKLVMHMDGSRLAGNSAAADDMEANRTVGSATQIAKTLLAAAEMELTKEQARLRQKYRATVSMSRG
jgi:hypothetical protein